MGGEKPEVVIEKEHEIYYYIAMNALEKEGDCYGLDR